MTIYQEEMQRKAQRYGCITDYDEADQLLLISHKGVHLTAVNPEGFMFYNSKELTDPESREVFSHLVDDAETVREYVGLYESSPQMKPKDVQNYRKLSEYGDVVFAGMYSQKHGFMFCSWRQSDGGKYLAHPCYENVEWTIREISPSEGYLLDETVYYIDTYADQYTVELNTVYPDVYEDIIKGKITIIKHPVSAPSSITATPPTSPPKKPTSKVRSLSARN